MTAAIGGAGQTRLNASEAELEGYRARLDAALAKVDRVFSAGLPEAVDACPLCFPDGDLALLKGDLQDIPDELVIRFAHRGPEHWPGDQYGRVWRGLAPRILRLAAYRPDQVVVAWALRGAGSRQAGFGEWPANQRYALIEAYAALLGTALTRWPAGEVIELFGPLAQLYNDIDPWFGRLDALTGPAADAGIVRLAAQWCDDMLRGHRPQWAWHSPDPNELAIGWFTARPVGERLLGFADRNPDCDTVTAAIHIVGSLATGRTPDWDVVHSIEPCLACGI